MYLSVSIILFSYRSYNLNKKGFTDIKASCIMNYKFKN